MKVETIAIAVLMLALGVVASYVARLCTAAHRRRRRLQWLRGGAIAMQLHRPSGAQAVRREVRA